MQDRGGSGSCLYFSFSYVCVSMCVYVCMCALCGGPQMMFAIILDYSSISLIDTGPDNQI